jgi:PAS domain S-box-containing protein
LGRVKVSDGLVCELCYVGAWVAPAPFIVANGETVVFANHSALRALGYADASELVGKGIDTVLHPDVLDAARVRQEMVVSASRRFHATPTKMLTSDGCAAQYNVDIYPLEVEGRVLVAAEFDIAEWPPPTRKAPPAPQLGAIAPQLGWALLEASPTPIIIQDVDTILFANRIARDRLGVSERTDLEGQPIMSIAHPDALLAAVQRVAWVFGTHQSVHNVPTKLRCPDGRALHVIADANPINAQGYWAAVLVTRSVRESEPLSS